MFTAFHDKHKAEATATADASAATDLGSNETGDASNARAALIVNIATAPRTPENRRKILERAYTCRLCGQRAIPVLGPTRIWHFRHGRGVACDWEAWSEHESAEHQGLKRACAAAMRDLFPECRVTYEHIIPEARRIADLLVVTKDGEELAVECQLASITLDQLEERTLSYERNGLDVIWVFRKDRVESTRGTLFKSFYDWLFERGNFVMLAEPQVKVIEKKLGLYDAAPAS